MPNPPPGFSEFYKRKEEEIKNTFRSMYLIDLKSLLNEIGSDPSVIEYLKTCFRLIQEQDDELREYTKKRQGYDSQLTSTDTACTSASGHCECYVCDSNNGETDPERLKEEYAQAMAQYEEAKNSFEARDREIVTAIEVCTEAFRHIVDVLVTTLHDVTFGQ